MYPGAESDWKMNPRHSRSILHPYPSIARKAPEGDELTNADSLTAYRGKFPRGKRGGVHIFGTLCTNGGCCLPRFRLDVVWDSFSFGIVGVWI